MNDIQICSHCTNEVTGKFCANCGQPAHLKRVDFHYISHEVQHLLHFEKGFLFTVKELLLRPGQTVKEFISYNRSRLVKPIVFLIESSLIYSLAEHFFHIEGAYVAFSSDKVSATSAIFEWVQDHYGYANIIMGVFIAMCIKVFFRKYPYNLFERLILLCFIMGMAMQILAVFAVIDGLLKVKLMQVAGYLAVAYCAWAIGSFFDRTKVMSYIKGLSAYILGMITFTVVGLLIGAVIDLFYKN